MGDVDEGPDDVATSRRTTPAGGWQDELLLDLSQIHVRLGDLGSCVEDYKQALSLRTGVLGRYDKTVADCHFGLAQAYAKAPSKIEEGEGRVDAFVSDLVGRPLGGGGEGGGDGGDGAALLMTEERKAEYRDLDARPAPCVLVNQGRIRGHPPQTAAARRRTMRSAAP
jgi:hypothetical protein